MCKRCLMYYHAILFFLFSRVDGDSNQAFSDSISGINIYDKVN